MAALPEEQRDRVRRTLDALERLVRRFDSDSDDERLFVYSAVETLLCDLEGLNEGDHPTGNVRMYLAELRGACRALARLEHTTHSDMNHTSWAISSVWKLRSVHAFGV